MHVVGFDPGTTGAIAVIDSEGALVAVTDMPAVGKDVSSVLVRDWLVEHTERVALAVIENVHSMPKQGVASSFRFGRSKGVLEGIVGAMRWPLMMPSPASWKKAMRITSDKDSGRALALDMWPAHASLFARKKDADRAEAALMAEWGRRQLLESGKLNPPARRRIKRLTRE